MNPQCFLTQQIIADAQAVEQYILYLADRGNSYWDRKVVYASALVQARQIEELVERLYAQLHDLEPICV